MVLKTEKNVHIGPKKFTEGQRVSKCDQIRPKTVIVGLKSFQKWLQRYESIKKFNKRPNSVIAVLKIVQKVYISPKKYQKIFSEGQKVSKWYQNRPKRLIGLKIHLFLLFINVKTKETFKNLKKTLIDQSPLKPPRNPFSPFNRKSRQKQFLTSFLHKFLSSSSSDTHVSSSLLLIKVPKITTI